MARPKLCDWIRRYVLFSILLLLFSLNENNEIFCSSISFLTTISTYRKLILSYDKLSKKNKNEKNSPKIGYRFNGNKNKYSITAELHMFFDPIRFLVIEYCTNNVMIVSKCDTIKILWFENVWHEWNPCEWFSVSLSLCVYLCKRAFTILVSDSTAFKVANEFNLIWKLLDSFSPYDVPSGTTNIELNFRYK